MPESFSTDWFVIGRFTVLQVRDRVRKHNKLLESQCVSMETSPA